MDSASAEDADPAEQPVEDTGATEGEAREFAASEEAPGGGSLGVLLGVAAITILIDQLTKWWVVSALEVGEKYDVFWKLRMNHVLNEGASFGQGASFGPIIGVIAGLVGLGIIYMGRRVRRPWVGGTLGLILGGAWGNMFDRLFRAGDGFLGGPVVDFVDVQFWPVWNIADMAIWGGGIALVVMTIREGEDIFT